MNLNFLSKLPQIPRILVATGMLCVVVMVYMIVMNFSSSLIVQSNDLLVIIAFLINIISTMALAYVFYLVGYAVIKSNDEKEV